MLGDPNAYHRAGGDGRRRLPAWCPVGGVARPGVVWHDGLHLRLVTAANADDEIEQLCEVLVQMVEHFQFEPVDDPFIS